MKGLTREQGLRWTAYGLVALLVLIGAYAGMLFLKVDEAESAATAAQKAADDASAATAKAQAQIKTATARAAEAEQKLQPLLVARAQLEKIEADVAPALEAAGKSGKPNTRAAALAALGVIGQVVHGVKHEAALSAYDRALAADKENCAAQVGVNLSGEKTVELSEACKGMMPAAEAKPAAAAAPAAAAPAAPAPAKAEDKGDKAEKK